MMPAHALLLRCPYCGAHKEVLNLLSGNTIGGHQWSDTKTFFPMLPRISPIQQCEVCGKYYFAADHIDGEWDDYSMKKGMLTYEQLKEARKQFLAEGYLADSSKRLTMNLELVKAYNDLYNRDNSEDLSASSLPSEDRDFIGTVLDEIVNDTEDVLVKAEMLRESGRFDESLSVLDSCTLEDDNLKSVADKIRERTSLHNSTAFLVY